MKKRSKILRIQNKAQGPTSQNGESIALAKIQESLKEYKKRKEQNKNGLIVYSDDESKNEYLLAVANQISNMSMTINICLFCLGELLMDAKRLLPHGEFGKWIEDLGVFSVTKANYCMRIYQLAVGYPNLIIAIGKFSLLELMSRRNFPKDLLEYFDQKVAGVYDFSKAELLAVRESYSKGEITLDDEEVQKIIRKQKNVDVRERWKRDLSKDIEYLNKRIIHYQNFQSPTSYDALLDKDFEAVKFYRHTASTFRDILAGVQILYDNQAPGDDLAYKPRGHSLNKKNVGKAELQDMISKQDMSSLLEEVAIDKYNRYLEMELCPDDFCWGEDNNEDAVYDEYLDTCAANIAHKARYPMEEKYENIC